MTGRALPEWIARHDDQAIPPRVQLRIFMRRDGRCASCERKIATGEVWHCDHITALINGGHHAESNLQALCLWCHTGKTKSDVAEKSATYRKRRAHHGIRSTRPSFGTNRNAPFKKKMTGEVVRRLCR